MNILKSFDLNSTTLKKIENFDGKICSLWFLLYMCKISLKFYH
jgi:hypothetical protein